MSLDAGDSGCTTGLSGSIYTGWTGDYPANGFGSAEAGFASGVRALLKAQAYRWSVAIAAAVNALFTLAAVQAPTFAGTWVNFGGGYANAGYWKDPFGVVHLRGLVKSGTIGTAIFFLPVGYRPVAHVYRITVSNNTVGVLDIRSDGSVIAQAGSNVHFSLAGASFRTDS